MRGNNEPVAVEEIAPSRFFIRDTRAHPFLKGEGELRGYLFDHTSWRRDGLIARLRNAGLVVQTLDDQINALPALPAAPPLGQPTWRAQTHPAERFSQFNLRLFRWEELPTTQHNGDNGVFIVAGLPIRRRKGRGVGDFYHTAPERQGLRMIPASENQALMLGYAIASAQGSPAIQAEAFEEQWRLPLIELPRQHHELLLRWTLIDQKRFIIPPDSIGYTQKLFGRLGAQILF